jgi:photosynthetic reaction center cytochrome c subunit
MMKFGTQLVLGAAALAALAVGGVVIGTTERPPMESVQRGFRGLGMEQIYNPRFLARTREANVAPISLPRLPDAGPKAGQVYKNVPVLKDQSVGNFTRLMVSITNWVSPVQGCAYCHDVNDMASDALYTKVVSRKMIQMVQHINSDWQTHVVATGVTCFTCHRGQPVPANIWFQNPGPVQARGYAQIPNGKNHPTEVAGYTALPYDPFTPFLEDAKDIRVEGTTALPNGNLTSIKQTNWTYSLMFHLSGALGVNCTYCHNTRSFTDWAGSTPQRVTAWYGIRMTRELNNNYLNPLLPVLPAARLGPLGDAPKVNCATCHQGVYKPLFGVSLAKDFPELQKASP